MTCMRVSSVKFRSRQHGVVLFIALIFLVLLTVMALTTFNISKGGQQIIGNMVSRNQAFQAAWQTSEAAISTNRLIDTPSQVLCDPVTGTCGMTADVDIDGDGKTIINTAVSTPTCNSANLVSPLNLRMPADLGCLNNYSPTGVTLSCYDLVVQFVTTASDAKTKAATSVTQGAAIRAQPDKAQNTCVSPSGIHYLG